MITIKKYSNRRLYDTDASRYVTLQEVHHKIRDGADVCVVDAKTNADLTQTILAQIVIESRGAGRLLPLPLLVQIIRMDDDALAEFLGRYVAWALGVYSQMRSTSRAFGNPMAMFGTPWGGQQNQGWGAPMPPWSRRPESDWAAPPPWSEPPQPQRGHAPKASAAAQTAPAEASQVAGAMADEMAELKRQIAELRAVMTAAHAADDG